ncbi:TetR/AcrR family transcriptional regulator [Gulosibacter molinativorax]|uniref:TetR/AcrR family transcriptional regulator n=1 Tax=Gulosibacter molinativorax TaxID=256821 RepID=A0ABT7C728_9MICO|nr:TetR/AcrR family transcriptional regulator [Gulosibacter molinativorax]MDJ1370471.1 TetR/AcrR family transcriptional regulator [Gulosibacter molinativorax]QUY62119.1 HTH-type transcriptional regulator YjdC [Gulosibacter molinativorax]
MVSEDDLVEVLRVPELTPGARRILDVAGELFYRRGIHAVGVDTIAAESGITKRTLYDRFGSKENLVAAYLQARHRRWWDCMTQRLVEEPSSPVLALFDSYFKDAESTSRGCAFINAAAELSADHPGFRVVQAHKHAVRQQVRALIRESHPANAEELADHVFLLLEGAISHQGIEGNDSLFARARGAIARLLQDSGSEICPSV